MSDVSEPVGTPASEGCTHSRRWVCADGCRSCKDCDAFFPADDCVLGPHQPSSLPLQQADPKPADRVDWQREVRWSKALTDWLVALPWESGDRTGWHYIDTHAMVRLDEAVAALADAEQSELRAELAYKESLYVGIIGELNGRLAAIQALHQTNHPWCEHCGIEEAFNS